MFAQTTSLADRFTWLLEGLLKVIGTDAHQRRMEAALAWAAWNRVRLLGERLIALIARARAGRLRAARRTPHPDPPAQGGRERSAADAAHQVLPRAFGWITRALPATVQWAGVLAWLLRDPEVAALVEKAPQQAGRILRPLCHLLGVKAPEFLRRGYAPAEPQPPVAAPPPRTERDDDDAAGGDVSTVALPPPQPSPAKAGEGEESRDDVTPQPAAPPPAPPPRPRSWFEQEAAAMQERAARWEARQTGPPSTLLPLGLSPTLAFPDTGPPGGGAKNRR
jgi:hypothetical protein